MGRVWTCQKCRTINPRIKQRCSCGRKRPPSRPPAHRAALEEPYEVWVEWYGERCGICGALPKKGKKLHRDHEHRGDGRPRGLLCFRCNAALRPYMTLPWMRNAVRYLERPGP